VRLVVITCAVLEDEIGALLEPNGPTLQVVQLPQGLHDKPPRLRTELQETIEAVETEYHPDAIALGYGLCSRGIEGVHAQAARIVVVRAHDCITLLLGGRERYAEYVAAHPGTYWYSPGWNKNHLPPGPERYAHLRNHYIDQYGEDNADFLMESEQSWFKTYDRATFVHLGAGEVRKERANTKACAKWLGWGYDQVTGDPALLRDLINGRWDGDRFLVLEPGQTLRMTADDRIIEAIPFVANESCE